MTTFYISGPMRNKPGHNYAQFNEVEDALYAWLLDRSEHSANVAPWDILNPARNFDGDTTRDTNDYMQLDMEMVLKSDVIVLLPGWEESEGAAREVQLATWTGKRFMLAKHYDYGWEFHDCDVPTQTPSPRASVLEEAQQLITGDRNNAYGPPTQDFKRTADMASAFGFQVNGSALQSHHVAIFMILLKMSRLAWTPTKRDSWVDTAGYAGCGWECANGDTQSQ